MSDAISAIETLGIDGLVAFTGSAVVVLWGILVLVAFRQGREIALWPPKVGPRPSETKSRRNRSFSQDTIPGKRLFTYKGYYPVEIAEGSNRPSLNSEVYAEALCYFLSDAAEDQLAAMDLVYLREDNLNIRDVLRARDRDLYERLVTKYQLRDFRREYRRETDRLFENIKRVIDDLGRTLRGVRFEILLHDVRNPLQSIIAEANAAEVSKRQVGDPSTRFVVNYVKHQGRSIIEAMESGNKVAYQKQFTRTKKVKATTTPLWDQKYGLIGILCFNIDMESIEALDESGRAAFFEAYLDAPGEAPDFEKEDAPE